MSHFLLYLKNYFKTLCLNGAGNVLFTGILKNIFLKKRDCGSWYRERKSLVRNFVFRIRNKQHLQNFVYYFLFIIRSFVILVGGIYAQETVRGENDDFRETLCNTRNDRDVDGLLHVKSGVTQEYSVLLDEKDSGYQNEIDDKNREQFVYRLVDESGRVIQEFQGPIFQYTFSATGSYSLEIERRSGTLCSEQKSYTIYVYDTLYAYIGGSIEELLLVRDSMIQSGVYFHTFIFEDTQSSEYIKKKLTDDFYYIEYADVLLLEGSQISNFFDALGVIQQFVEADIRDLNLYVLADINPSAFRRMLARYHTIMGLKQIYVLEKQYIGSLFASLFLQRDVSTLAFVKTYTIDLEYSNKFLVFSYIVDYLLQNSFPLSVLLYILILPVVVLVISILRQIIGLSVFGVFNPLLFAFSLSILGISLTLTFFVSAFIATLLMRLFVKKIYLLYSAKISLLIVLYTTISMFALRILHSFFGFEWLKYDIFQNTYVLFPFIFLIMVGVRVFSEKFYLFDKGRRIGVLEFFGVSFVVYQILSSSRIQNILLGYPELSIASIFILLLIGRFTGLQLLEYIRFMPLIRRYFEEE